MYEGGGMRPRSLTKYFRVFLFPWVSTPLTILIHKFIVATLD